MTRTDTRTARIRIPLVRSESREWSSDEWSPVGRIVVFKYGASPPETTMFFDASAITTLWLEQHPSIQNVDDLARVLGVNEPTETDFIRSHNLRRYVCSAANRMVFSEGSSTSEEFSASENLHSVLRGAVSENTNLPQSALAAAAAAIERLEQRTAESVDTWADALSRDLSAHND